MQPGCKFDHMLVLVGEQDLGKSRCLRLLAEALAPDVYTDRLSSLKEKDSMIELLGKVVVEMAEMVAIQGASVEQIKRFLSAQEDDLRMPWDRTTSRLPRSCVFAGTINPDGLGFLTDPTGSRRFWPVTVTKADFVAVAAEAAQMWAEALVRYEAGEHWWIEDAVLRQAAVDAAAEHTEFDVWAPRIDEIISTKTFVRCDQVLRDLGLDVNQMGRREQHRVAHHLRKAGWRQAVWRQGGINTRGWAAPRGARLVDEPIDDDPGPEDR